MAENFKFVRSHPNFCIGTIPLYVYPLVIFIKQYRWIDFGFLSNGGNKIEFTVVPILNLTSKPDSFFIEQYLLFTESLVTNM